MRAELVAPCGINCGVCMAYMRKRNPCAGCNGDSENMPKHCVQCAIRRCEKRAGGPTGTCACDTPCKRLKTLDKTYREKYHMSLLENLQCIRQTGMAAFLAKEKDRWRCPGCKSVITPHSDACPACGRALWQ